MQLPNKQIIVFIKQNTNLLGSAILLGLEIANHYYIRLEQKVLNDLAS